VLVDALQKVGMRYRPQRQLWAAAVLLNTRGLELTLLKNYLDDGGDYHTCYKLCYNDLQARCRLCAASRLGLQGVWCPGPAMFQQLVAARRAVRHALNRALPPVCPRRVRCSSR
jgi:hypothetical protein